MTEDGESGVSRGMVILANAACFLAAGVRAPTFEIAGSDGMLDSASVESLNASGRSVLAFLHYVARHPRS
jgi:hypothetical protein